MDIEIAFIPGMPGRQVVELARRAEALGYATLYLPDQTFHRDPFALLALCAEATSRIRLGLAVTNPYTRHPIQVARAAGLLAEVSEGRFVLGYGTGNRARVLTGFGLQQTHMVARVREAVDVVRRLLNGEIVTHESEGLSVNGVSLDFAVPGPVPIYVATRGPRLLRLAGEIADGVMFEGLFTPSGVEYALGQVDQGLQAAGRAAGSVRTIAWQALSIGDDEEMASRPEFKRWAALLISSTQDPILAALGFSRSTIESVRAEILAKGVEEAVTALGPEDVRRLLLVGTPSQVGEQVAALGRQGVDAMASIVLGGYAQVLTTMETFAELTRGQAVQGAGA
jgi:5,10-methylenetetrahydromethanopterin reductase